MYMKNMKLKVLLVLCALLLLSAFIAERKAPITIFMIGDSTTVSYTHLDVYKRQVVT